MGHAVGALLVVAFVSIAGAAHALATYGAELTAQLRLTAILDAAGAPIPRSPLLGIGGEASLFDTFTDTSGSASAAAPYTADVTAADPSDLAVGDGLDQVAGASGSVAPPPPGSSAALASTDGLIFFDNRSRSETFRVAFELRWAWSLDVALDDPGVESVHADVALLLESLSGGTLFALLEEAAAPGSTSDSGTFLGELVLGPLDFDELGVVTDASGRASAVPEPSTLTLIAVAVAWASALRGRRARVRS
jgi:hypothetical protein